MKNKIEKEVLKEQQEIIKDFCYGRVEREVKIKSVEEIRNIIIDTGYGRINIHAVNIEYLLKLIKRLEKEQQKTAQSIFDDKEITHQFACLESWCKSRGKGKDYCSNCKKLNRLKKEYGVK